MLVRFAPAVFVCLWATGFVGARLAMPYSEPGTFLSIRFASAFFLLVFIALAFSASWPGWRDAMTAVVVGTLIHGIYLGGVFWAIDQGMPAGVSAVIVGLQPLLTALLAGLWLGEVITRNHLMGLGLGITGVVLVLAPKLDIANSGVTLPTIAACLFGMICVTLGTIIQKRFGENGDLRTATAFQYLGAFIPVFLLALFTETGTIVWSFEMIFAMAWAILILSLVAIFLLMWLIRQGSVSQVSTLLFLVPAVAALMSYGLFGEQLNIIQLGGMVLCAVAVFLASARARDRSSPLAKNRQNPR